MQHWGDVLAGLAGEFQRGEARIPDLRNPVVTAPIIGPRTLEQFDTCLRAVELELSDEVLARLDAIWPGPGGEAPNAYAW